MVTATQCNVNLPQAFIGRIAHAIKRAEQGKHPKGTCDGSSTLHRMLTPTSCRTSTNQLVKPRAQRELWTTLPKPKRHERPKQKPRLGVVPKLTHQGHLRQRLRHRVPQVVQVLPHPQRLALLRPNLRTSRCPQRRSQLGHLLPTNHNKRPSTRRNALTDLTYFLLHIDDYWALCGVLHLHW